MIKPNLPELDSPKVPYSFRIYMETLEKLVALEQETGISKQNLIRTAINNFLDELKKEGK